MESIYSRRSIRKYTTRPVTRDQVQMLIEAAIQAPSAMNRQPWAFIVIQRPELLKRISDSTKKRILESAEWAKDLEHKHIPLDNPKFDIFYGTSTLVVICQKQEDGFCPVGDCYLAGQNFMLAAESLGLGTCPIGFARDILQTKEFRQELSVPGNYVPVLPLIVGYPTGSAPPTPRSAASIFAWIE